MSNGSTGGVVSSNAGYSGTPLWKLKQQGALPRLDQREEDTKAAKEAELAEEEAAARVRAPSALRSGLLLLFRGSPVDAAASGRIPSALRFGHKVADHHEHRCSLAHYLQPGSEPED